MIFVHYGSYSRRRSLVTVRDSHYKAETSKVLRNRIAFLVLVFGALVTYSVVV
jgi:hypothetical protein